MTATTLESARLHRRAKATETATQFVDQLDFRQTLPSGIRSDAIELMAAMLMEFYHAGAGDVLREAMSDLEGRARQSINSEASESN